MGIREEGHPVVAVSVITTVYNEGAGIVALVDSVLSGTVAPAEMVVADGGSDDGTVELLEEYAARDPRVRLIRDAGGRSRGRNLAIEAATHDLIVSIDGGCVATPTWLEEISRPLLAGADWVAGFYRPEGDSDLSTAIGLTMVFVEEEVVFPDFLPSARSMAFARHLWEEVGGFPEEVQYAEDTAFGEALAAAGHTPVFVSDAVVEWHPPRGLVAQAKTAYAWGKGDGMLGLRGFHYRHLLPRFAAAGVLLVALLALQPLLFPLAVLPLAPITHRKSVAKYRHVDGWRGRLLVLVATANGLAASLTGFVVGYLGRRLGAGAPAPGLPSAHHP